MEPLTPFQFTPVNKFSSVFLPLSGNRVQLCYFSRANILLVSKLISALQDLCIRSVFISLHGKASSRSRGGGGGSGIALSHGFTTGILREDVRKMLCWRSISFDSWWVRGSARVETDARIDCVSRCFFFYRWLKLAKLSLEVFRNFDFSFVFSQNC